MFDNLIKLGFDRQTLVNVGQIQNKTNDIQQILYSISSSNWILMHNRNTKNVIIQIYNENNEMVIPFNTIISENGISIYFSENISGILNIMFINGEI